MLDEKVQAKLQKTRIKNAIRLWLRPQMSDSGDDALERVCGSLSVSQIKTRARSIRKQYIEAGEPLDYREWPRYNDTPEMVLESQKLRAEAWGVSLEQVQEEDRETDRQDWMEGKYTFLSFEYGVDND